MKKHRKQFLGYSYGFVGQRGILIKVVRNPVLLFSALLLLSGSEVKGQTLRGSESSVNRAYQRAKEHDFTFLETGQQIRSFVEAGYLVPIGNGLDYTIHDVSFPYGRPEVKLFVGRLSGQYRRACGEKLVVTSLTRPISGQPRNASSLSVHPTGMAIDFRRSNSAVCRNWLESTLLYLEGVAVLEATRERRPPHFHVSIFPDQYEKYVQALMNNPGRTGSTHVVRNGESLWRIARAYGTSVSRLKAVNKIRGDQIVPGQILSLPGG
jgi:hypothetical protein